MALRIAFVVCLGVFERPRLAAVAAVVGGLEGLQQLVALRLVDRQVVGDQHPVRALELLER